MSVKKTSDNKDPFQKRCKYLKFLVYLSRFYIDRQIIRILFCQNEGEMKKLVDIKDNIHTRTAHHFPIGSHTCRICSIKTAI